MKFIIGLLVEPIIDADDLKLAPSSPIYPMLSLIERHGITMKSRVNDPRFPSTDYALVFRSPFESNFALLFPFFRAKIRASEEKGEAI